MHYPRIQTSVTVELTPMAIAKAFWQMDSHAQAAFFNHLAHEVGDAWFGMQMQYVTDEDFLTKDARRLMQTIGDYAYPYKETKCFTS